MPMNGAILGNDLAANDQGDPLGQAVADALAAIDPAAADAAAVARWKTIITTILNHPGTWAYVAGKVVDHITMNGLVTINAIPVTVTPGIPVQVVPATGTGATIAPPGAGTATGTGTIS